MHINDLWRRRVLIPHSQLKFEAMLKETASINQAFVLLDHFYIFLCLFLIFNHVIPRGEDNYIVYRITITIPLPFFFFFFWYKQLTSKLSKVLGFSFWVLGSISMLFVEHIWKWYSTMRGESVQNSALFVHYPKSVILKSNEKYLHDFFASGEVLTQLYYLENLMTGISLTVEVSILIMRIFSRGSTSLAEVSQSCSWYCWFLEMRRQRSISTSNPCPGRPDGCW